MTQTTNDNSPYRQVSNKKPDLQGQAKDLGAFEPEPFDEDTFGVHGLTLTRAAVDKVADLLEREGRQDLRLRVQVSAGGCAGLEHSIYFDDRFIEGDGVMVQGDIEVIVDRASQPYLDGAIIGYEDSINNQGFQLDNPNATESCACGSSFG